MQRYFKYSIIFWFLFGSCKSSEKLLSDVWVGTNRSIDMTIPYPYFIQMNEHQIELLDYKSQIVDSVNVHKTTETGDTILFKNNPSLILWKSNDVLNTFPLNDTLSFPISEGNLNWKYRIRFRKALQANIKSQVNLEYRTFKCPEMPNNPNTDLKINKYWKFENGQLTTTYDYYYLGQYIYQEYQKTAYTLTRIDDLLFISENVDPVNNPKTLYQVLKISDSGMTLRYFDDSDEKIEEFTTISSLKVPMAGKEFHPCFEGFTGEYYYTSTGDVTYLKGNDFLVKKISDQAPVSKGDGYINVHFTVNCRGEIGHIGLEQMDTNFQKIAFDFGLVNHIISQVVQLKDWPSIDGEYLGFKDVHAFLMFKIENGKITDLCP